MVLEDLVRTKIQREANDIDLELFRLAERCDLNGWQNSAVEIMRARGQVRSHMHSLDRVNT